MAASQSPISNPHSPQDFVTAGVNLTFSYAAGEAASRFLVALRDERVIYGTRCPECRRVLVPARSFCPRCFVDTAEWLAVGPQGVVTAVAPRTPPSALSSPDRGHPLAASSAFSLQPSAFALIRLDGADTALVHRVGETARLAPRVGLRVVAVFAEDRTGSILDIDHFAPISPPAIEDRWD